MARERSRLGEMMRLYCVVKGISEREVAKQLGMNSATFHRLMHGHEITLSKVMPFLGWLLEAPPSTGDKHE